MSKPIPKRHHYIPEMLQKRFVNDSGGLWFYSKERPDRGIVATKPGNVFVEGHLYSSVEADGSKNPALELHYSKVESLTDPIIEKMVLSARSRRVPSLSPTELEIWNHFFFYQQKRVPDFFGEIEDIKNFSDRIEEVLASLEAEIGRPIPAHLRQQVTDEDAVERLKKNAIVGSLFDPATMVMEVLQARGLVIAVPRRETKSFVLGSNPMARMGTRNGSSLGNPEVELWLPIAQDVAVTPYGRPGEVRIIVLEDFQIRKVNQGIFGRSTMMASGSKDLIESLRAPR